MRSTDRVRLSFGTEMVRIGSRATEWTGAVREVGDLLVAAGCARQGYQRRLIDVIERYGPYMVIAPNLALVHAQPGPDVMRGGLAAVTLPEGVNFGHPHFDPVGLVIGLTSKNPAQHLEVIAGVATALERNPHLVETAVRSASAEALVALLREQLPLLDLG